jgi:hypothetical protein
VTGDQGTKLGGVGVVGYTVPEGVDTMLDVVGVGWPNVDEDAYRDMADALREFADDADDAGHSAQRPIQRLVWSGNSEALTALTGHWSKVQGKYKDVARAARIIGEMAEAAVEEIVAKLTEPAFQSLENIGADLTPLSKPAPPQLPSFLPSTELGRGLHGATSSQAAGEGALMGGQTALT